MAPTRGCGCLTQRWACLLLLASKAVLQADAFLNLGKLEYSNLGGQGPDLMQPKSMRYKDVAAVGGKFLDLVIEAQGGYTPFDSTENAPSGKGDQVGSINIRVGTSVDMRFRFVEADSDTSSSSDRFFFTIYLGHMKQKVVVHANATGPSKSSGLNSLCVADSTVLDLQVQDNSKSVLLSPDVELAGQGGFAHDPAVRDPYELGDRLKQQAVTLSFSRVSEFVVSVGVGGMVGEEGANLMFSGTATVDEYCLDWVGGDGKYYDYVPPAPPSPLLGILACIAGSVVAVVLALLLIKQVGLNRTLRTFCQKQDSLSLAAYITTEKVRDSLGEAREASRVDSVTPLMMSKMDEPVNSRPLESTTPGCVKFHVTVLKTAQGGDIGLRIKTLEDSLMIRSIHPEGLISEWNRDIPDKEVRLDDFIVEVNGAKGNGGFLEDAMMSDKAVKLTILRDDVKAAYINLMEPKVTHTPAPSTEKKATGSTTNSGLETLPSIPSPSTSAPAPVTSSPRPSSTPSVASASARGDIDAGIVAVPVSSSRPSLGSDRKLADIKGEEKERLEATLAKKEFGHNSKMLRRTKTLLSTVEGELGNPRRQVEILEESLQELEEEVGPDDPEVAQVLTNLANAHANLGDPTKQKDLLLRALQIKEKKFGLHDRRLAVTLTSLGDAYGTLGDQDRQFEALERALHIKEEAFGTDHHEVAVTLANIGIAYRRVGDPQKALEFFERSVDIKEAEYGRDHPKVALTLGNMAQAHGDLGNTRTQRELLERSLHILETHYGPDHPHTALARQALTAVKQGTMRRGQTRGLASQKSMKALPAP